MIIRTIFAILVSAAWIAGLYFYIAKEVGIENIRPLLPTEHGTMLLAAIAPLVLFWLFIAYYQAGADSRRNARTTRDLIGQLGKLQEQQEAALLVNEKQSRRAAILQVAEFTTRDLESIAGDILQRFNGVAAANKPTDGRTGHDLIFKQTVSIIEANRERAHEVLSGLDDWPKSVTGYCEKFERLRSQVEAADGESGLGDYFADSAMGQLSTLLRNVIDQEARKSPETTIVDSIDETDTAPPMA